MVDIAAYGAHPDDLELCIGGALALHCRSGRRVIGVDLSRGEMSTNGRPETRVREAQEAAAILGLEKRVNLELPDLGIKATPENLKVVVESIRSLRPKIILAPYWESYHPDHAGAGRLLKEGAFLCGLAKYVTDNPPWKTAAVYFYALPPSVTPSFVVDVTAYYDLKTAAIKKHASQMLPGPDKKPTAINDPHFLEQLRVLDAYWGQQAGCRYGEPFFSLKIPLFDDLFGYKGGALR